MATPAVLTRTASSRAAPARAGIGVGDCVRLRMYAESVRFHDIREVDCPP